MTSPLNRSLSPQGGLPEGLRLPEVIITRRTRTISMNGRIGDAKSDGSSEISDRGRFVAYFMIILCFFLKKKIQYFKKRMFPLKS